MGGGGGSSGPTVQQQQLETQQATTQANLNLEENAQRKAILNSMLGTRVFRGSALSRAVRGNTPGTTDTRGTGPASLAQRSANAAPVATAPQSLIDLIRGSTTGSGATPAGGTGASGAGAAGGGVRGGGSGRGQIP